MVSFLLIVRNLKGNRPSQMSSKLQIMRDSVNETKYIYKDLSPKF